MLNGAGLAVLPASLGGATSSFCQKPNVPNISKDRFECVLIICTMQNHIEMSTKWEKSKIAILHKKVNFLSILTAACNYWRWGGSGSQENINAICILGLNIVNDKVRAGGQRQQHRPSSCIAIIADQVFLVLWWWFLLLLLIGLLRLIYRAIQCRCWCSWSWYIIWGILWCQKLHRIIGGYILCSRSAWLRYHLLTMRLYQNFKKSSKVEPIKAFVKAAKLGDWWAKNFQPTFLLQVCSLPAQQKPQPIILHGLSWPS